MNPSTYLAGVMSNDGLSACEPAGAMRTPPISVTSSSGRSSMTMPDPSAVAKSKVDLGAAT